MSRTNIRFSTFLLMLLIVTSVFAIMANAQNNKYELFKESVYNRALNELNDCINDVNVNLAKIEYLTSPSELNTVTSLINGAVNTAKSFIGQLPLNNVSLDKLQKYLTQTASYVTLISNKKLSNEEVSDEEYETLIKLKSYSNELVQQFSLLQDITRTNGNIVKAMTNTSFGDIPEIISLDNIFAEYPTLIYDGPFSDSDKLEIRNYHILEKEYPIDMIKAEKIARSFIGQAIRLKSYLNEDITPAVYTYSCGNAYVDITKNGGRLLRFAIDQPVTEIVLKESEALSACKAFIENQGYTNMTETYYMSESGILMANYAYTQGDIICYSDLIKVGVTLDTGKVCYYDADSYLKNHIARDIPSVIIPESEAAEKVTGKLEIKNSRMALIPTEYGKEKFCYEFSCVNSNGEQYLVYINAVNGNQENVLMLLDTGHGTLTT
jgi:hypothetical protein